MADSNMKHAAADGGAQKSAKRRKALVASLVACCALVAAIGGWAFASSNASSDGTTAAPQEESLEIDRTYPVAGSLLPASAVVVAAEDAAEAGDVEGDAAEAGEQSSDAGAGGAQVATDGPNVFYVLLMGDDTRDGTIAAGTGGHGADGNSRSDTIMLVRVDPDTYKITLVTVPRDTRTSIDGETVKLNETFSRQGPEGVVNAVNQVAGVNIKYYMVSTMAGFINFTDSIGGVDANVPFALTFGDMVNGGKVTVPGGFGHLNGIEALIWVRNRMQYADPMDAARQIQDRAYVKTVIEMAMGAGKDGVATYANALYPTIRTNYPQDELVKTMQAFAENRDKVTIYSGTGPYDGGIDEATQLWLTYENSAQWAQIMGVVKAGGDPATIIPDAPVAWNGQ